jgi:hypothetical protein
MRKIYVTEKQLHEALGMSLSYLNNSENGASASHYDSEITVNGNITGETETTMDKISKSKAPRSYFGARKRMATINCSIDSNKKKLFETNQDLVDKTYTIPDDLYTILKNNFNSVSSRHNIDGIKRLKNLINARVINTNEMYRLKSDFERMDSKSDEYRLLGGTKMKRWIEQQLKTATTMSKHSKDVKHMLGDTNAYIKKHQKTGTGTAHTVKKNNVQFNYE